MHGREAGAILVPSPAAEEAKNALVRHGLMDGSRRSVKGPAGVVFHVTDVAAALAVLPEAAPSDVTGRERPDRDPHARVREALAAAGRTASLLGAVPRKWEKLGDVVLVRVPDELRDHEPALARAFAEVLDARTVLADEGGVAGEFREMAKTRFLLGDDAVTTHIENGVHYKLDAGRLMFSSGNVAERRRVAGFPVEGETVVDLFAGIGYFTLPLAVYGKPARLIACEKNPLAFRYLEENVRLNEVNACVETRLGDNRDVTVEGGADRVHLGYVGTTHTFLEHGFRLLKPEGGVLHYHDTASADWWDAEMETWVRRAAEAAGRSWRITHERIVKTYSPGIVHAVMDIAVS